MKKRSLRILCFALAFMMIFMSVDLPVLAAGIDAAVESADESAEYEEDVQEESADSEEAETTEDESSTSEEGESSEEAVTSEEDIISEEDETIGEDSFPQEGTSENAEETDETTTEDSEVLEAPVDEEDTSVQEEETNDIEYPVNGIQFREAEVDFDALGLEEIEVDENLPGDGTANYNFYATSPYADWHGASSYYVYNKLDDYEKSLWNALEKEYSSYLEGNKNLSEFTNYISFSKSKMTLQDVKSFLIVFRYTHPEYYFLNNAYSISQSSLTPNYYNATWGVYGAFQNGTDRSAATAEIDDLLDDWCAQVNTSATEEAKVAKIHALICNKVDYNTPATYDGADEEVHFSQTAYSVFCTDLTVCAGYALAFEWVANMCGVDSIAVTAPNHAYNKVRINDNWYNIDLTWNDQGSYIIYDYYLRDDTNFDINASIYHNEEAYWDGLLPTCTLDSGSTTYVMGTLPTVSNQVSAPVITAEAGDTAYTITITTATPGATIYYTTDGTEPSEARTDSKIYTGPFQINMTGSVKAIAVCNEYLDSTISNKELELIRYTVASGSHGSNLIWTLDSGGYLKITGSGSMASKSSQSSYPWGKYAADIREVELEYGITSISSNAFSGCKNLEYIYIPQTVSSVASKSIVSAASIMGYPGSAANTYATNNKNLFLDITAYGIRVQYVTGYSTTVNDQYYLDGSYAKEPTALTRTGYDFGGWYTSATVQNDTTKWDFTNTVLENDVILYAKWTAKVYQLSFDANYAGAEAIAGRSIAYDSTYATLPVLNRTGYTFEGWYTKATGGALVTDEVVFNTLGNVTLYAHWTANTYTVSFEMDGGTADKDSMTITYDQVYGTLPVVQKTGYTFNGWYDAAEGGNLITKTTVVKTTENQTLYAHWTANTYVVTLVHFGGNRFPHDVTYDEEYGSFVMTEIEGYVFEGWYTEDGTLIEEDTIVKIAEDHTLYSKWSGLPYVVSFDEGAGNLDVEQTDIIFGDAYGTLPTPQRTGYTFAGWYTEAGDLITAESVVDIASNHTLYARYTPNVYMIKFDANGTTAKVEPIEVTYDSVYGELPVPETAGGTFLGWFTQAEGGVEVKADDMVTILENQTLYAHWEFKYTAAAPVASRPNAEEVYKGTKISLTSETNGALIYYTTDPAIGQNVNSENGILYEEAIVVEEAVTIYAVAVKAQHKNSDVLVVFYSVIDESQDWGDITEADKLEYGLVTTDDIPANLWATGIADCDYTGKAITFTDLRVYDYKTLLTPKVDYTVKYSNNTKAGTATVTITGKGNYTGTIVKKFTIHPLDLSGATVADVVVPYNGKVQKATTTVTYELNGTKVTLKSGTDFTYTYPGTNSKLDDYDKNAFKLADEYTVTLVGKGNYTGTTTFTQTISEKYVIGKMKLSSIANQKYNNGSAIEPVITIKNGSKTLVKGTDYTVEYSNNTAVGTATVTITGIGDYTGTRTATFKITGTALSKMKFNGFVSSVPWTGSEVKQNATFSYTTGSGDNKVTHYLAEGTDYTVSYQNNVKIGTATVIYTGINGYTGSVKKTYKITGISMSKVSVSGLITSMVYDGKAMEQSGYELTYTTGTGVNKQVTVLQEGDDYRVSYQKNTAAGTAYIVFTGINGYTGTVKKSYKITKYSLASTDGKIDVAEIGTQVYTKDGAKPKPVVTYTNDEGTIVLTEGKDYTLSYANNKAVADKTALKAPTVTIIGKGSFSGKTAVKFNVVASDLDVTTITATDVVYQKKAGICKPTITLVDTNGKKLTAGTDYNKTIAYVYAKDTEVIQIINRKEVRIVREQGETVNKLDIIPVGAEITATVTGMKLYGGSTSVTFRYIAKNISSATVSVKAQYYTGKAVEPTKDDIVVKFGKVVLAKTDYEIVGYSNNVNKGTGKVIIRGIGNYGGVKTISFKINNRTMNYTISYDKNATNATGTMKDSSTAVGKALTANAYKRTGYVFVGWNTQADGSGESYANKEAFYLKNGDKVYGSKITLYAQWKAK